MLSTKKPTSIVGLDVEAGNIAATELRSNGSEVARTAIEPLAAGVVNEGEFRIWTRSPTRSAPSLRGTS